MAGGFLSGLLAGAAVSGLALGAASVLIAPGGGAGPDAALDVPSGSGFSQTRDDTAARLPARDGAPEVVGDAPQVDVPAPDDLSQVATEDTQPGTRPEITAPEADLSAPEMGDDTSGMAISSSDAASAAEDASAAPNPAEEDQSISTDPAQPSLPDVEEGADYSAGDTPDEAAGDADPAPESSAPRPETDQGKDTDGDTDEAATDAGEADTDAPPSGTIGDEAPEIETSRLPSVGAAPTEPAPQGESADAGEPQADLPAIEAFAAPFENPEGKPLMAIVLIDDGTSPIKLDALESFPYPLSFAVDATAPEAGAAMRRYRDAGFEVMAIANLPPGATARDTETTMQTVRTALPEAVAILEGSGEGLQIGREASEQLAPILLETGQGIVLFSKGLETAPKLIAREGVPVGTVFRDFDAKGQSATVIRRFLDQAAFKAGRDEEGVIMLGRLRADTISALLLWGLQDRASRVALAPISAVLTAQE